MASKPVTLKIERRGRKIPKLPAETSIYIQGSARALYDRIAAETRLPSHRLRITKASDGSLVPNDTRITVDSTGLRDGSVIQIKDLGPQIAWRTVFVIEYLGPLLIHPVFYLLRPHLYRNAMTTATTLQTLSCIAITVHFLKRELETLFVHRFSNASMPAFNIFKNSAHYWLLSGLLIALTTYSPSSYAATAPTNRALTSLALTLYIIGELANLQTHLVLRSLRSAGGTERGIPQGLGFTWVTCPNYLFELVAWTGVLLLTRSWGTAVFMVVAGAQMAVWAQKKEQRYRKESGAKYKRKRFVMVPGIW